MEKPLEKLTLVTVGIATIKLLLGGAVIEYAGKKVGLGQPDAGSIGAILGPVLAAYAASLHRSFRDENKNGIPDEDEPAKK